jgi:peptidyl-prolyl cis-trans isomerase SurA
LKTSLQPVRGATLVTLTVVMGLLCACAAASAQAAAQQSTPRVQTSPVPQAAGLPQVPGQPVDRVVAIVNGDLVLDSDVDEERRFETIQPFRYNRAAGLSDTREAAVERLVNRALILQQAQLIPGNDISDADVDKEIAEVRKQIPACRAEDCGTQIGWTRYLGEHGFTPEEFRARWKQRMQVLAFIEERFRQGVKIEPADIKAFYEKTMLPEYARQHAKAPPLAEISDRIEEVLLEQQVTALLRDWLKSLRAQGSVVVMHPGEEAP